MAIQYVGGVTATAAGSTATTTTVSLNGTLSGGIGTTPAPGDLVIVTTSVASLADKAAANLAPTTAGYRTIADLYANDSVDANVGVYIKIMGATPDVNVVLPATGVAADGLAVAIQVWRGVDPISTLDFVAPVTVVAINGRFVNPGAITPVTTGAYVIVAGGAATTATATTPVPTGLSNIVATSLGTGTNRPMVGMGALAWTAGTVDPAAWTGGTSANTEANASVIFAIRPIDRDFRRWDFESGVLASSGARTNSTGTSVVTGQGQVGTYAGAVTVQAATPMGFILTDSIGPSTSGVTEFYYRYRFKINTTVNPTGNVTILTGQVKNPSNSILISQRLTVAATTGVTTLQTIDNVNGSAVLGTTYTLANNTWYELEGSYTVSGTTATVKVALNGLTLTNTTQTVSAGTTVRQFDVSALSNGLAITSTMYYDEVEIGSVPLTASTTANPIVLGRATGRDAADATSHALTFPTGVQAGEMLFALVASDNNTSIRIGAGSGWNKITELLSSGVSSAIYWKIADGTTNDSLTLTTSTSEQMSWITYRILGGRYVDFRSEVFSATANINPPSISGSQLHHRIQPYLMLAALAADVQVVATAAPANYSTLTTIAGATTTGVSISSAERSLYGDGDDPGAFTNASATAHVYTIAVSPFDPYLDSFPTVMGREFIETTAGTSHTITAPPSTTAGDLLVASVAAVGSATLSYSGGNATGWREVSELAHTGTSTTVSTGLYWKIADGTAADNLTITTSVSTTAELLMDRIIGGARIAFNVLGITASGSADALPNPIDLSLTGSSGGMDTPHPRPYLFLNRVCFNSGGFPGVGSGYFAFNTNTVNFGQWSFTAGTPYVWQGVIVEPKPQRNMEFIGSAGITILGTTGTSTLSLTGLTDGYEGPETAPRAGDLVVAMYTVSSTDATPVPNGGLSISTAGYTTIDYIHQYGDSTYKSSSLVAYKFMGSTPDTSIVFNQTGNAANGGTAYVFVFRYVDPSSPILIAPRRSAATGTAAPDLPAIGYVPSDSWVMNIATQAAATAPTGFSFTDVAAVRFRTGATTDTNSQTGLYYASRPVERLVNPAAMTGGAASAVGSYVTQSFALRTAQVPEVYKWDFESGDFDNIREWSASLASVVTGEGQVGTYAGRIEMNSNEGVTFTQNLDTTIIYAQWRFKVVVTAPPTTAPEEMNLFTFRSNYVNSLVDVRGVVNTDSTYALRVHINNSSTTLTPDYPISLNTWYVASIGINAGYKNNGTVEFRINNTPVISGTALNNAGVFRHAIQKIQFRGNPPLIGQNLTATGYIIFDEVEYDVNDWPVYPITPGGLLKVWNGSAWVEKPVKFWNGSAWVEKPVKYWNGSAWVLT